MTPDRTQNSSASAPTELYKLRNKNGIEVGLLNYGATIANLITPDKEGRLDDICPGFADLQQYENNSFYFGGTIGRFANRIKHGTFTIDGKKYQLAANDGAHSLHGGVQGFDKHIWNAKESSAGHGSSVRFSRLSPDNEEGYPGNLDVKVTYTLTDDDELIIFYEAATDQPTVVNLTNHAYFNLAGKEGLDILHHEIRIHADYYTPADSELIPTGQLAKVQDTPMDFRSWKEIGARIQELGNSPRGYDHNYVLHKSPDKSALDLAAEAYEPASGRRLEVYTDQPGMQFYSGNFLNDSITGKNGRPCSQYGGFCLETQNFPDSPNQPTFPSAVLRPNEIYKSKTIYKFSTN